jgi:hypothetical protein
MPRSLLASKTWLGCPQGTSCQSSAINSIVQREGPEQLVALFLYFTLPLVSYRTPIGLLGLLSDSDQTPIRLLGLLVESDWTARTLLRLKQLVQKMK